MTNSRVRKAGVKVGKARTGGVKRFKGSVAKRQEVLQTPNGPVFVRYRITKRTKTGRAVAKVVVLVPARVNLSQRSQKAVRNHLEQRYPNAALEFDHAAEPIRSTEPDQRTQAEEASAGDQKLDALRSSLVDMFSPEIDDLDPTPRATVEQARRLALVKSALMESGAFDYETLAAAWDTSIETTRKRVRRAIDRYELFTVSYKDRTFVPAFLLDGQLEPRAELAPIIATLEAVGETGFALWAWLTTPTSWLDGDTPEEAAVANPERVLAAASERAFTAA